MFNERTIGNFLNLLDWDAASYAYSRATLDSKPYQIVKEDDKSSIVFNALGIKKENIKVEIDRQRGQDYLVISGETKNELLNRVYSVTGRFLVDSDTIKNVDWTTEDGLLKVDVYFKNSEKPKVKINMK